MSENPLRDAIAEAIRDNQVILFMKGTPEQPMCGFSARAAGALQATGVPFAAVDILPDPRIRQELSAITNWPTTANGEPTVEHFDIVNNPENDADGTRSVAFTGELFI